MASWYESAPLVEEPKTPQGRVFIPNAAGQRNDQRDQTRTDIAVEGNERDAARFGSDVDNRRIDNTISLSDKFNKDKDVAGYRESLTNFATGLRTAPNPQGDNALITAYVKVFDPGSVVNEGEREGVASSQGAIANQIEAAKKNFGMDNSGLFTAEARKRIRREMSSIMTQRNQLYNERRAYFRQQAQDFNLDPKVIIGDHAGARFRDEFTAYDEANGIGKKQEEESARGPIPGATMDNLAFDSDTGTGAFGSEITGQRLTPQQEAAVKAYIQANAGDPNFNEERFKSFYQSLGITGLAPTSDPAFYESVRKGEGFSTAADYSRVDEDAKRAALEASYKELPQGADASTYGMEKGLLLNMTDELRGGVGGIRSLLSGDGFMSGYESERDIERALQMRSREQNGVLPEIAGSLLTPAGVLSRANMARDAAAMGAVAGFGEGEGLQDSLAKGATGAGIGYGAGKAFDAGVPMVANSAIGQRVSQALGGRGREATDFAAAAERQGLDYLPADIPGRTGTQFATAITKSTLGGIPLADAAVKIQEKARTARDRIAGEVGAVADNVGAGQSAQRGMQAWEKQTAGRGGELYEAIPIKPDTPVALTATRQKLAELNGSISSNADLAALVRDPKMAAYQKALEAGDLSWQDTKTFRSYIGEKAGRPTLQQDTSKDSLDALYGSLSQDIQQAATAHSPEAAKAFSRANNYWRGRQTRLNDVMTKLVGKDGNMAPEATFAQIERWAGVKGGDYGTLTRAVRSMPADEANTVRATIIDRLGDASAGRQNAEGNAFSPDTFLTQWSNLSDRAKAVLFQGEHRKALDDLATVFDGSKASRGFDNNSRTGIATSGLGTLAAIMLEPITGSAIAGGQFLTGKLLASPKFARWLAASAKKPNPSAQLAHVNQLTAIARSEPVIANDIFTLQERLADAFAQPLPGRLAAEENDPKGQRPPENGERDDAQ